jgi:hypothetical protein
MQNTLADTMYTVDTAGMADMAETLPDRAGMANMAEMLPDRAGIVDSLNMLDTLAAMGLTAPVKTMGLTATTDRVALLAMMKMLALSATRMVAPSAMMKMMVVLSAMMDMLVLLATVKIVRAVVALPVDGEPGTLRRYTRRYPDSLALGRQRTLARTLAPKETAPRASWPAPSESPHLELAVAMYLLYSALLAPLEHADRPSPAGAHHQTASSPSTTRRS